ncbi:MAG: hypothetical protein KDD89_15405 [Anaerolineales bacterium]|nr:hypothetical protein [Anaerolineales bacterium]
MKGLLIFVFKRVAKAEWVEALFGMQMDVGLLWERKVLARLCELLATSEPMALLRSPHAHHYVQV